MFIRISPSDCKPQAPEQVRFPYCFLTLLTAPFQSVLRAGVTISPKSQEPGLLNVPQQSNKVIFDFGYYTVAHFIF